MITVAVLGGSGASTPELAWALRGSPLTARGLRLVLAGRSEEKLCRVVGAAAALAGGEVDVRGETSIERAVSGADFIVNQVRVGGLQARLFDETFPREFGIPGEETLGPGGFANALRTLPVVLEQARVIEKEAPEAWVVNLTNPAGMVQQALERCTSVKAVSVCDSPATLLTQAARVAGPGVAEYVGMNHVGWLTGYRGPDGEDRMASLLGEVRRGGREATPVDASLAAALGCIPNPYLRFYYHPDRMLAAQQSKRPRAEELLDLERDLLHAYGSPGAERPEALVRRGAAWYAEAAVPALEALAGCGRIEIVCCRGNGDTIPWLSGDAAVEVPTALDSSGIGPRRPARLPPDARALLAQHASFEQLTVEGVLEGDEGRLVRALAINPLVPSWDVARSILRRIREQPPA